MSEVLTAMPQIILPGVYRDMPIGKYHGGPGLSNTGLNNLAKSPFHFYSRHMDPNRPPSTAKPGQLEGNLAHCTILEPLEFHERYVIGPSENRNTKVWKQFVADNPGFIAIQQDQYEVAQAQAASVRNVADVAELLSRGESEVSVYWNEPVIDADTGEVIEVLCRCRPDWVHPVNETSVILCDVKTFSSADKREFAYQVDRKGYARQNAFYANGYEKATGKKVVGFVFIAVEDEFPFAAGAYMLPDEWVELANREVQYLMKRYVKCVSTNSWPSYCSSVELLSMPARLARG